jgi:hypothetical protein
VSAFAGAAADAAVCSDAVVADAATGTAEVFGVTVGLEPFGVGFGGVGAASAPCALFFGSRLSIAALVRSAIATAGSFGASGLASGRYGASGRRTFGLCCAGVGAWLAGISGFGAAAPALAICAFAVGDVADVAAALGVGLWVFAAGHRDGLAIDFL